MNSINNTKEYEVYDFSILQYLGNKKKLLPFIKENIYDYLDYGDTLMDLFSGTAIVGYNFKKTNIVYSNDIAPFAYEIGKALIENNKICNFEEIKNNFISYYLENKKHLYKILDNYIKEESELLTNNKINELINFYKSMPNYPYSSFKNIDINEYRKYNKLFPYMLFTLYYNNNYFGLHQTIDIDSIKYSIDNCTLNEVEKSILYASLFYAINECSFSRDGHFAQYIDLQKNKKRLINRRKRSIYKYFIKKLNDFCSNDFIINTKMLETGNNFAFSVDYSQIFKIPEIINNIDLIYADPPYTTNKYSRYYHLLDTLVLYDYPQISKNNRGNFTKGLYRDQRYKSPFTSKVDAIKEISNLFLLCKLNKKILVFSYAYPMYPEIQDVSRYSASIEEIIENGKGIFGKENFIVKYKSYEHANQRNKSNKKVNEYLLIGKY